MTDAAESPNLAFAKTRVDRGPAPENASETPKTAPASEQSASAAALHKRVIQLREEDEAESAERLAELHEKLHGTQGEILKKGVTTGISKEVMDDVRTAIETHELQRSQKAGGIQEEIPEEEAAKGKPLSGGTSGMRSVVIPQGLHGDGARISTEPGSTLGISLKKLERQEIVNRRRKQAKAQQELKSGLAALSEEEIESGMRNIPSSEKKPVQSRTKRALATSVKTPSKVDWKKAS